MTERDIIDVEKGEISEACLYRAERVYSERAGIDTNPVIAQMIVNGRPVPHWYYRSNQWIDQAYEAPSVGLFAYVGPTEQAPPHLREGTYLKDPEFTQRARRMLETRKTPRKPGEISAVKF